MFGLLISLYCFYAYSISKSISYFVEIKKFRTKKLIKNTKSIDSINKDLDYSLWLTSYSCVNFLK